MIDCDAARHPPSRPRVARLPLTATPEVEEAAEVEEVTYNAPMLTEFEAGRAWQEMFEAEVRSMYYAELSSRYIRLRQLLTGVSLFLSSGAAATILSKSPTWVPLTLSIVTAAITAYLIASGIERTVATTGKLHASWNRLAKDYENIWHHWKDDDAKELYRQLQSRAAEASQLATEAPYREELLVKWQARISEKYERPTIA